MTYGALQASQMGPFVWHVMYDDFLRMELSAGTSIIGSADDVLVMCAADDVGILELRINESLWRAKRWLDSRSLGVAPEKTEALLVTDRRSFKYPKIVLGEHEIEYKMSIEYLGVQLDQRLSFGEHLQIATAKVIQCGAALTRLVPNIRKDGRWRLVEKWQTRWHGDQSGRWTLRLIPELATWLDRKHGRVGFYLAQALSGHGCFNAYLKRFKKRDDESCCYYGSLVENAEHILFVCTRWGAERESVGRAVGAQLTPDTMVSLMLQSEQIWMLIESFVTLVMKTREFHGRAGCGNNGGQ